MEAALILGALLLLLIVRVPVALAMAALGIFLLLLKGLPLIGVPQRIYGTLDSFELLAVPMFLLMSNVLLKGGVGKDLFGAAQTWVGHWPGGLGAATIISCALFSAISGSSVATAATIGTVALPEMTKRGYDRSFVLGLLAAGGTLGILIPPSIPLIIFGVITEESIPALFLAGIGPGLFLAMVFLIYNMVYARRSPNYQPVEKASAAERKSASLMALPTIALAVVVIGSIYLGVATPSEAAGLGFVLSLITTVAMGRMTREKLIESVETAMKTTVMILVIILAAKVFSYAITLYLIPQQISAAIMDNISSPAMFMLAVGLVLLIIGFFLEALAMMLIMVPVLFPSLLAMGIDPIWFGIFFVVLIETALITPPVGLNLFVIQAIGKARIEEVVKGALPFAIIMLCTAGLLWFWPGLALTIPSALR